MSFVSDQDVCTGLENLPVFFKGNFSKDDLPLFQYSPENVPGPGCETDPTEVTLPGCDCRSQSCQQGSCSCLQAHRQAYDRQGHLKRHWEEETEYSLPVFECNVLCGCSDACGNRVVQRGLGLSLCVFPSHGKGWGLRALEPVPRGRFVCEYAGEVIGMEEARQRQRAQRPGDMNYIIVVREHGGGGRLRETVVDPAAVGNVGRFLNHSCQPNLFMVPVRVHSLVPKLALFAGRDIAPGEELTFDYSGAYNNNPQGKGSHPSLSGQPAKGVGEEDFKRKPCHCGAQNCNLFLPLDVSIISNT
ncbi:histone-lysine N-methyltransferase SETMAR isoform X1 [Conger conger]|uniref:histone-lysine N-methyltransferase SETMAR isoform X1 n=1 Tax=Conger conger TaxID=82655 RepID=UPI002A5ABDD9|nr:histone-lysine N-methyltransferase SETMAR isoform X1 [Conger conger]